MMALSEILYGVSLVDVLGSTSREVTSLKTNSKEVESGSCFIAVKGHTTDGHRFIQSAIDNGASAIVCETLPNTTEEGLTYVKVKDSKAAVGVMADNFFGNPSKSLKLVGVTGTNGKTTVATLAYQLFKTLGFKVGLLSTIENKIDEETSASTHTTPDPISLQALLKQMLDAGCTYCFMEVSSHAIDQKRIAGLRFAGGVFTNISRDHLDYHKTFPEYIKVKKAFFDALPAEAFCLINGDDRNGALMGANTRAKVFTYGIKTLGTYHAKILENAFSGLHLKIGQQEVHTKLIGAFNASNLLALFGISQQLEIPEEEALTVLSKLESAKGRFSYHVSPKDKIVGIVDYAHTPDALEKVLQTINAIRQGKEQITTVLGCGGDRDKGKRPEMAAVACEFSDRVVFTSDNPRSENPQDIIEDMIAGVQEKFEEKYLLSIDRREAIKTAVMMATKEDIILIAGKGHENYQEVHGEKVPFDDKEELLKAYKTLKK